MPETSAVQLMPLPMTAPLMSYTAWYGAAPVCAASMTSEFAACENSCARRLADVADVVAGAARRLNVSVARPAAAGAVVASGPAVPGTEPPPPEHAASAGSAVSGERANEMRGHASAFSTGR